MSTTVLQNNGLSSIGWQQVVYNQIVSRKSEELTEQTKVIEERYESQNAYLDTRANQWARVKASINNAELAVDNGKDGVKDIKSYLLNMRILVGKYAEADTSETKDELKTQYDELVDKINRSADMYASAYNPIGKVVSTDWTPNTISFQVDPSGKESSYTGTYIGSDYYIKSDDGTTWVPDPGSSTIQQYHLYKTDNPADSDKADGFASTRNGLRLDSYDPETGMITMTVDPENAATQVTGTITFGGLGLMQSWFYGNLDTEEGRSKAIAAIDRADSLVTATESNLVSMQAGIGATDRRVEDEMNTLKSDRSEAMKTQMVDTYAAQIKQQQELQVLKNTFENMAAQKTYYESIFAGTQKSELFDFTA